MPEPINVEARLQYLEMQFERLTPSIRERLNRIEESIAQPLSEQQIESSFLARVFKGAKNAVRWMGGELPKFLSAAVLLILGWGIKDSVDLSIKQRQLNLAYSKEMQVLLQKMSDEGMDASQLESTAIVLASYGQSSLPPLISELRYTGLRSDAAAAGIASLGLSNPEAVCEALPRILSNRGRQFDWRAHQKVARLLGENGCYNATGQLIKYRNDVLAAQRGDSQKLLQYMRDPPRSPKDDYQRLLRTVDRSLQLLEN